MCLGTKPDLIRQQNIWHVGYVPAKDITYFARVDFRNDNRLFGIRDHDRFSHIYAIGKTGTGKSTLLETIVLQDIDRGKGAALIDPHGDLADAVAKNIPDRRKDDLLYLNAADPSQPYGYNPLRRVRDDRIALAASGLMEVFKRTWTDGWGVRMEHIMRNGIMALLERPHSTLPDLLRIFADKEFRKEVVGQIRNETVRTFFQQEFERYSYAYRADGIAPIQNKVGAFLADPLLNRILTKPQIDLHIREVMDRGKILLVNLAKGRIGDDSASLLGGLLVTTIGLAAFSRADLDPKDRHDFFICVDEFQNFTTLSLANMLSELRKYRIGFAMAHQYQHQLEPEIRHSVLGNCGTIISFRVGAEDAPYLAREFAGVFDAVDLQNLPNHHIYLKLMIDGQPPRPFSAKTIRHRAELIF